MICSFKGGHCNYSLMTPRDLATPLQTDDDTRPNNEIFLLETLLMTMWFSDPLVRDFAKCVAMLALEGRPGST
jgi:hypothetical protein